jgi:hypothetical protein
VVASGSTLSLSWTEPASPSGLTHYVVEIGTFSGGSNFASHSTGSPATAVTIEAVPAGIYFVRVRAGNSTGLGPASNEVTVSVGPPAPGTPGAPRGLAGSVSGSTVTLSWVGPTEGAAPSGYQIEAGSAPGLRDLASFQTGTTATSFSVGNVPAGTYFVRVRAVNGPFTSAPSNEFVLLVGSVGGCTVAPSAPALTFALQGSTVTLQWSPSAGGPTSYVIEAGTFAGGTNIVAADLGNTFTSLSATVGPGAYFVRVRGRNACGTSGPSNEVSIVVP